MYLVSYKASVLCLLRLIYDKVFICFSDCPTMKPEISNFLNTTDNITFHIQNDQDIGRFRFYKQHKGQTKHLFDLNIFLSYPHFHFFDKTYTNRTSVAIIHESFPNMELIVTITNAEHADNGTYYVEDRFDSFRMCFTVYIIGK